MCEWLSAIALWQRYVVNSNALSHDVLIDADGSAGVQAETVETRKLGQTDMQAETAKTEELNETALDFVDSFMGRRQIPVFIKIK